VRPLLASEEGSKDVIAVAPSQEELKVFTNNYFNNGERKFVFEKVLDRDSKQVEVFEHCAEALCDCFLAGQNCNIIVYGPTSTGKTYTMQGAVRPPKMEGVKTHRRRGVQRASRVSYGTASFLQNETQLAEAVAESDEKGLIPRVIDRLFSKKCTDDFNVKLSYLEIYNDGVTDLLEEANQLHAVKENALRGVYVEGLSEMEVRTIGEAYLQFFRGLHKKKVFATYRNR